MLLRSLSFVALVVTFLGGSQLSAQDAPPVDDFAAIHAQWEKTSGEIEALIEEYRRAKPERRKELLEKFPALDKARRALMSRLKSAAMAAYEKAPNKDKKVTETLLDLTAGSLALDRNRDARQITKLLAKNGCEVKGFHDLAGTAAFCSEDFDAAGRHYKKAAEAGAISVQSKRNLDRIEQFKKDWKAEAALRAAEKEADNLPRVKFETSQGTIIIELFENEAPQSVANFISLVEAGFYDGLKFHRVLPNFMAQGGCPLGTGTGGPKYKIYCECYKKGYRRHFSGTLSMAHAGRNTGGSQFFLTFRPTPHLDGRHTAFGRVIEGMDVPPKLQRVDPRNPGGPQPDKIKKATVVRKRDHEYKPTKVK